MSKTQTASRAQQNAVDWSSIAGVTPDIVELVAAMGEKSIGLRDSLTDPSQRNDFIDGWLGSFDSGRQVIDPLSSNQKSKTTQVAGLNGFSYLDARYTNNKPSTGEVIDYIRDSMARQGYSQNAIAATLGQIHAESGFNAADKHTDVNRKTVGGLFQWNGSRFTNMAKFANNLGADWTNPFAQVDFLLAELASTPAGRALKSADSVAAAQDALLSSLRPQGWTSSNPGNTIHYDKRMGLSEEYAKQLNGLTPGALFATAFGVPTSATHQADILGVMDGIFSTMLTDSNPFNLSATAQAAEQPAETKTSQSVAAPESPFSAAVQAALSEINDLGVKQAPAAIEPAQSLAIDITPTPVKAFSITVPGGTKQAGGLDSVQQQINRATGAAEQLARQDLSAGFKIDSAFGAPMAAGQSSREALNSAFGITTLGIDPATIATEIPTKTNFAAGNVADPFSNLDLQLELAKAFDTSPIAPSPFDSDLQEELQGDQVAAGRARTNVGASVTAPKTGQAEDDSDTKTKTGVFDILGSGINSMQGMIGALLGGVVTGSPLGAIAGGVIGEKIARGGLSFGGIGDMLGGIRSGLFSGGPFASSPTGTVSNPSMSLFDSITAAKTTGMSMGIGQRDNGTFGWGSTGIELTPGAFAAGWSSNNPERSGGYGTGKDPTPTSRDGWQKM